jgi:signal peptidase I
MRKLFSQDPELDVWIEGNADNADSKVLLTISNTTGTKTVLVTPSTVAQSEAKYFVETPPERIVTKSQIRVKKATTALRFTGYLMSAVVITFAGLSTAGFVKARVVLTGSMAPAINPGDVVISAPPSRLSPEVGEVATYTGRRFSGEVVGLFTHRIIGGNAETGFIMKGDANATPDVQRPKINDINGVVFFVIPFIGYLLSAKTLALLIPLIIGIWFIADALRDPRD